MPVQHTRIPFSDLVFLDDNPRTRTAEGLQQMAADIQADPTFFENRPVLVNLTDGTHQVYAGDLRAHAAHDVLGWADIPCNVERDVPAEVMRRRAIIDNLHRETWAPDILTTSWASDDLEAWGLTPDKWGDAADTPDTPAAGYTASEDDYDPPPEIVTDIVPGDLFEIGPHRLLCGDSTNADDVAKVMGGEKADLVLTDPPFGNNLGYGRGQLGERTIEGDDNVEVIKQMPAIFEVFSKNDIHICVWIQWRTFCDLVEFFKAYKLRTVVVWDKKQPGLSGGGFAEQHEWMAVFLKGEARQNEYSGNVWQCPRESSFEGRIEHPHKKPVEILGRALELMSNSENLILDPFLGSGTTMVAAHQLNRRCYGIEIDPKYCQVILDRMLKLDPTLTITRNGKKYLPAEALAKEGTPPF